MKKYILMGAAAFALLSSCAAQPAFAGEWLDGLSDDSYVIMAKITGSKNFSSAWAGRVFGDMAACEQFLKVEARTDEQWVVSFMQLKAMVEQHHDKIESVTCHSVPEAKILSKPSTPA